MWWVGVTVEGSVLDRDQLMEDSVGEAVRLCRRSGTRLCISSCDIKSIQRHKSFDSQQPKVKWRFFFLRKLSGPESRVLSEFFSQVGSRWYSGLPQGRWRTQCPGGGCLASCLYQSLPAWYCLAFPLTICRWHRQQMKRRRSWKRVFRSLIVSSSSWPWLAWHTSSYGCIMRTASLASSIISCSQWPFFCQQLEQSTSLHY